MFAITPKYSTLTKQNFYYLVRQPVKINVTDVSSAILLNAIVLPYSYCWRHFRYMNNMSYVCNKYQVARKRHLIYVLRMWYVLYVSFNTNGGNWTLIIHYIARTMYVHVRPHRIQEKYNFIFAYCGYDVDGLKIVL